MNKRQLEEMDQYLKKLLGKMYDADYYRDQELHSCASTENVVKPVSRRKYISGAKDE